MEPEDRNPNNFLKESDIFDFGHQSIKNLCHKISKKSNNEIDLAKNLFHFVRDEINHSGDIDAERVTCSASEVLEAGHGICLGKANLLIALLRCSGIPAGICYQILCADDDPAEKVIHGLVGVYLKDNTGWIRLDPRGNKPGVDAQFSINKERVAYPIRKDCGEEDIPFIYKFPNLLTIKILRKSKNRKELGRYMEIESQNIFQSLKG